MTHLSCENVNKTEDIRQIPKWARRYAMNRRAIPVALNMLVFLFFSAVIGGFSYFAGGAYRAGNTLLACLLAAPALLACVAVCIGSIYLAVPKWGGKRTERFFERFLGKEGVTTLSPPVATKQHVWVIWVVGIVYGSCILGSVLLGGRGYIPSEFMQPVSALYVVPFLLFLSYKMWSIAGPIPFLWPFLYALHAILIVAGAPILFTGKWEGLNMLVPIAGYGLLASMLGILYGRYSFRRLKRLARIESEAGAMEPEASDVD